MRGEREGGYEREEAKDLRERGVRERREREGEGVRG